MTGTSDFFVGWDAHPPRGLARFVCLVACSTLAVLLLLALALGRATDIGAGDIVGEATVKGVLEIRPYPFLRAPPDPTHLKGHVVLLAGDGKYGVGPDAERFAGHAVEARGALVKRGDIEMLLVSRDEAFRPAVVAVSNTPSSVPLGRWRVTGEICDGKCESGVMRPGKGLAHKACASLCVAGGVPPVFVATAPVEGAEFMLLADAGGGEAPAAMRDLIAIPVTLEGAVERRGDLTIFRVDWSSATPR